MRNFDEAFVTVAEASKIAGVNPGTTRAWIQDGWLRLSRKDRRAKVPGATTLLSGRRVLQLAIAGAAVALGVHPKIACRTAFEFTDVGDETRDPGALFGEDGNPFTALMIYPNETCAVVKVDRKTSILDVFFPRDPVAAGQGTRQDLGWHILLDFIVEHVTIKLEKLAHEATP
jgi:hypothetical protein